MEKITLKDGESADIIAGNIDKLKILFPDAFTEGGVNFDVLRQLLGDASSLDEGEEKYGLNWHGKKQAKQIALTPSTGTLLPRPEESVSWETTQNLFIEGDNLEVLKLLQKSYANKVKLIYIDPPYNTESDFIYPDKYSEGLNTYLAYTGQKTEGEWNISESGRESIGKKHTNWLRMMYPRLSLAKRLLLNDGVIAISIDDNEIAQLKVVMSEIFGEENFLNCVAVKMSEASGVKMAHVKSRLPKLKEYLMIYKKSDALSINPVTIRSEKWNEEYKHYLDGIDRNQIDKLKELFDSDELSKSSENFADDILRQAKMISCTDAHRKYNSEMNFEEWRWNNSWRIVQAVGSSSVKKLATSADKDDLQDIRSVLSPSGKLYLYKTGFNTDTKSPRIQVIFADLNIEQKVGDFWQDIRTTGAIGQEGGVIFPNGKKPQRLLRRIVQLFTNSESDDIVCDFFAGSGSTGQAVLDQNIEDGGNRRFILVQLPEHIAENEELHSLGYMKISDVTKARLKNVIDENGTGGFKVFTLDSSNIRAWNPDRSDLEGSLLYHKDHLVEGRSQNDVLFELLLKRGVDLSAPIDEKVFAGKKIYSIGYGALFACLENSVMADDVDAVAQGILDWHKELEPETDSHVFFRDSAFADDIAKTNMAAILEQNGISHVRSL